MIIAENSVLRLLVLVAGFILAGCGNGTTNVNEDMEKMWKNVTVPSKTPGAALAWIERNAENWDSCIVNLNGGTYELPNNNDIFCKGNFVRIILRADSPVTITLISDQQGHLIGVGKNIALILSNNITLKGIPNNTEALVIIYDKGKLEMRNGSRIFNNKNPSNVGGAVLVYNGFFTMEGGAIDNNESRQGGGVLIVDQSTFTMTGGEIKNNKALGGGGVAVADKSTFTITSGTIEHNEAGEVGGGVLLAQQSTLAMTNGEIKNNKALGGGGVAVVDKSTFTITNGTIEHNEAGEIGGGVLLAQQSTLAMINGEIKNNKAQGGGGVCILESNFTMSDNALINTNESGSLGGGGVRADQGSTFTMSGGTIEINKTTAIGGGVLVINQSTFVMTRGTIKNNSAKEGGGGILVANQAILTMSGSAQIDTNTAGDWGGGGVQILQDSTFTMNGGIIKNNNARGGSGVFVGNQSIFTMSDNAQIDTNTAGDWGGGGVLVFQNSIFTMDGGIIKNNITQTYGGGVFLSESIFRKNGQSVIESNTASSNGNATYAYPKYRNSDIPAKEDIFALWNTSTNSYDYEGIWDN